MSDNAKAKRNSKGWNRVMVYKFKRSALLKAEYGE